MDLGGTSRIYPFDKRAAKDLLRTHEQYKQNVKDARDKLDVVMGVKGSCLLSYLQYYEPVGSTCIDYMHSILEGVCKSLFKFWFDSEYSTQKFSLRKFQQEIDQRLSKIQIPRFISSTPRSVYDYKLWHAHEFLSFFLYFSLPVFHSILPFEFYNNLKKIVIFLEVILSKIIDVKKLN
jgi:hypothetical protein